MKEILACILALSFCTSTVEAKVKKVVKKVVKVVKKTQKKEVTPATQQQVQDQQTINKKIAALIDDILSKEISNCPKEEFNKCKEHPWLLSNNAEVKSFCRANENNNCKELLRFAEFIKEAEENMGREFGGVMQGDESLEKLANTMVKEEENPSDEFFNGVNSFIEELATRGFNVDESRKAFEKFKKIAYCFEKGENDAEVRKMFDEWKKAK